MSGKCNRKDEKRIGYNILIEEPEGNIQTFIYTYHWESSV
jgi:hypothetical protein